MAITHSIYLTDIPWKPFGKQTACGLYGVGGKPDPTAWYGELSAYMGGMQC